MLYFLRIRLIPPTIIPSILILDPQFAKLLRCHFETSNINSDKFPTNLRNIPSMKGMNATVFAKQIMNFDLLLDSVVAESIFRCEEAEGGWFDHRAPPPEFAAESAIAFRGSLFLEIDVDFIFDCAAVTAAVVRFPHI